MSTRAYRMQDSVSFSIIAYKHIERWQQRSYILAGCALDICDLEVTLFPLKLLADKASPTWSSCSGHVQQCDL